MHISQFESIKLKSRSITILRKIEGKKEENKLINSSKSFMYFNLKLKLFPILTSERFHKVQ